MAAKTEKFAALPIARQTSPVSIEGFLQLYKKAKASGITRDMFYDEYGQDMVVERIDSLCYSHAYGKAAAGRYGCFQYRAAGAGCHFSRCSAGVNTAFC